MAILIEKPQGITTVQWQSQKIISNAHRFANDGLENIFSEKTVPDK